MLQTLRDFISFHDFSLSHFFEKEKSSLDTQHGKWAFGIRENWDEIIFFDAVWNALQVFLKRSDTAKSVFINFKIPNL